MTKQTSDGGSTSYYELPAGATELNDLIEYKNMSFAVGNIFKAAYRLGQKEGAEEEYDLRKIIYFANRRLMQLTKEIFTGEQPSQEFIIPPHRRKFLDSIKEMETPLEGAKFPAMYGGLKEDGSDAF